MSDEVKVTTQRKTIIVYIPDKDGSQIRKLKAVLALEGKTLSAWVREKIAEKLETVNVQVTNK